MKLLYWERLSKMMVERVDRLPGPAVFRATDRKSRKKVKPVVETRKRWVGIGWVDEGPPRGDEPLLVMEEDDPALPKDKWSCTMAEHSRYRDEAQIARDALLAWDGACNPRGLLRSLTAMVDWYCDAGRGGKNKEDGVPHAPLVLMQAQILYLLGMGIGDVNEVDVSAALKRCRELAGDAP